MTRLFAGGYAEAGALGLYPLTLRADAITTHAPLIPFVNVSGAVRVPGTTRWWLVDECAHRVVLADQGAAWRTLAAVPSGGEGPCHLALHPTGTALAIANYDSGTVALLPLGADGLPSGAPATYRSPARGPNAERQTGPHAHWVGYAPDGRLYATDLGADRVVSFMAADHDLRWPAIAYEAPPGSGPRQLAFHPTKPIAYLVSELASTLTALRMGADGVLAAEAVLSTFPAGGAPGNLGGAIAIDVAGARLYVTNRGDDSIATFAIDAEGGVTAMAHVASGGRSPRFLLLHGDTLLVAHEKAGGVTAFARDARGLPSPIARADVPGAAFLGIIDA